MATTTRCPNTSCGCVSQLVDDPLGRIFRCPRCLTKLPTAPAAAADSGWTAIMRPSLRPGAGARDGGFPTSRVVARDRMIPAAVGVGAGGGAGFGGWDGDLSGLESGEMRIGGLGLEGESEYGPGSDPGLGFDESGEVVIEPFSRSGSLVSAWSSASRASRGSRASTVSRSDSASSASASGAIGSDEGQQFGRFRVLGVLGEGQHATVYRAHDAILDRHVALKVPRQGMLRTAKSLERFLGEARAQARLRHPRIVPVYEAGRAGDQHYIAMALIEGQSLAERLAEGPLTFRHAAEVVVELAEALAYAHAQGVVHRDVKPANVRLDPRGDVYLMDFGIAYRPDSDEVPVPPGTILGTPAYVAPEQAQGGQADVLPASDQYSLGAVCYELICGRPPFVGPPSYVLFHTIHHDPPSPRSVAPKVPRTLAAICLKALAKQPDRRYADCQQFADDLKRWLRRETPLVCRRGWTRIGR
jgi:eukaryotic-like serine/threonine-protein kinase